MTVAVITTCKIILQQLYTTDEENESLYLQQVAADGCEDQTGDNHAVRENRESHIHTAPSTHTQQ